jgi:hypothetical protein
MCIIDSDGALPRSEGRGILRVGFTAAEARADFGLLGVDEAIAVYAGLEPNRRHAWYGNQS